MHRAINLVLMLATLASAVALYAVKNDTRRLETRVAAQERALERARSDVAVLTAERAHLSTWCNVLAGRKICLANMARRIGVMKRGWKEN